MRRFILALVSALVIAAVPSTALMATVTVSDVCGADDGSVTLSYTYDNASNRVLSFILKNDGSKGSFYVQAVANDGTILYTASKKIGTAQSSQTFDVTNLNIFMVQRTGNHGTSLQLPFNIACEFTPRR